MQIPLFTVHVEICYRKISRKDRLKYFNEFNSKHFKFR